MSSGGGGDLRCDASGDDSLHVAPKRTGAEAGQAIVNVRINVWNHCHQLPSDWRA